MCVPSGTTLPEARPPQVILRDHPANQRAASDLACALWQPDPQRGLEEAVALLEGVLRIDPDNIDAQHNLDEMRAEACGSPS